MSDTVKASVVKEKRLQAEIAQQLLTSKSAKLLNQCVFLLLL